MKSLLLVDVSDYIFIIFSNMLKSGEPDEIYARKQITATAINMMGVLENLLK
jgi:hypothetical protein